MRKQAVRVNLVVSRVVNCTVWFRDFRTTVRTFPASLRARVRRFLSVYFMFYERHQVMQGRRPSVRTLFSWLLQRYMHSVTRPTYFRREDDLAYNGWCFRHTRPSFWAIDILFFSVAAVLSFIPFGIAPNPVIAFLSEVRCSEVTPSPVSTPYVVVSLQASTPFTVLALQGVGRSSAIPSAGRPITG